ncbi:peptide-methionine (R)-S-oxide reductase MsrB [Jannaschia seohaensis]|uniref:peptide-methionine (R)-S-oxide reductase n=1 Tax=Jannaschia seohaensis TaxID=475081 RepID=A0A2Y9BWB0_9RHOB|nr:peptide-methionine (R)-S-oxide reductase MsrB [Jannaschia seohaensis]PWJ22484.1 peptide-methionine (R)-S-oxide reductase [Jannaschia seohaensis]SSA38762.1 peptide-methionine (R)-S-oxide reductase [Jannaschia seohaensis]
MTDRRKILAGTAAFAALAALGACRDTRTATAAPGGFPIELSPEEWRARLTEAEFAVLRQEQTEPPFSSPLNENRAVGTYVCVGCANPVYASDTKYDSGTGWPSFWQPISSQAVGTKPDYKLILPRTEVHCARCGGHLGHVFDDGPPPTGKRHCINGIALDFVAA